MTHNYPDWAIERASSRGYDHEVHLEALELQDEDQIVLTHPYNWLTEDEVESITR